MKNLIVILLILLLPACTGWHKRGASVQQRSKIAQVKIYDHQEKYSLLHNELIRLQQMNSEPIKSDASTQLTILSESFSIKPNIISADGQTKFARFTYTVKFKLVDDNGVDILNEQSITVSENNYYTVDNPLGQDKLTADIQQQLRKSAANQILLRISLADSHNKNEN